jgi:hypothetical protein
MFNIGYWFLVIDRAYLGLIADAIFSPLPRLGEGGWGVRATAHRYISLPTKTRAVKAVKAPLLSPDRSSPAVLATFLMMFIAPLQFALVY